MGKYKKEFQEYLKGISKDKESITNFLKKIGVYDSENNIASNYGGKQNHK